MPGYIFGLYHRNLFRKKCLPGKKDEKKKNQTMGHPRGLILYSQITCLQDTHRKYPADKRMGL
jgi:hypothetical protein